MAHPFRHTAGFGKRMEYWIIGKMLKEGLDVYVPLVDDDAIDAVVRREPENVSPHVFRYTFCSYCLSQGYDMDTVSRWAGHTTKEMTEHYGYLQPDKIDYLTTQVNGATPPKPIPTKRTKPEDGQSPSKGASARRRFGGIMDDIELGRGKRKHK